MATPRYASEILLFNIGVESVKQNPDIPMPDLLGERSCVSGGIEEVGFKSVERLDGESNMIVSKSLTD